jgi:hypothetical protein
VTAVETVARARVRSGTSVEQLVSHPRLPLVAALESQRPAVHVWDCGGAELRELGAIGGDSRSYGDGHPWAARNPEIAIDWDRRDRAPSVAWHPDHPMLLVAALRSDQGATLVIFARAGQAGTPPTMRVLRRAIILDADGYKTPVFSADGRRFAIRGNAYQNSLEVFEFPSLDRAFALTLGEPNPGHPAPPEWREHYRAWSRQNIAFGAEPGVLWVGTPTGSLVELDLDNERAAAHNVLAGSTVTALCATATGEGDLALISVVADSVPSRPADARTAQDLVAALRPSSTNPPRFRRTATSRTSPC